MSISFEASSLPESSIKTCPEEKAFFNSRAKYLTLGKNIIRYVDVSSPVILKSLNMP